MVGSGWGGGNIIVDDKSPSIYGAFVEIPSGALSSNKTIIIRLALQNIKNTADIFGKRYINCGRGGEFFWLKLNNHCKTI